MATYRVYKSRTYSDTFTVNAPDEESAAAFAVDVEFEGGVVDDAYFEVDLVSEEDGDADYNVED